MNFQKHCPGCFHDKGGSAVCPVCKYDESLPRSPLFLPHGIIIGGQFRVGRVLGQPGGFGITYLGWDIHLQQRVAIKEFLPRDIVTRHPGVLDVATHTQETRSAFDFGKEQFLREARIVARLDHPNVVRVRSFFNANGTAYLVMDYYEGLSLGDYLSRVRNIIEPALAIPLILPVLDALQYVHEHGVVHRDLKPHNIYLATVGKPIVLDFGAARQAAGERAQSLSVVLTDGYAPLEQYQRRAAQGPWTDVYGTAATLYRMLAGVAPPTALDRLSDDPLEKGGWELIPASLRPALRRGLSLKPEERFQTAAEFAAALSDYRPFQPEIAEPAPVDVAPPPSPSGPSPSSSPSPPPESPAPAPPVPEMPEVPAAGAAPPSSRASGPARAPEAGAVSVPVVPLPAFDPGAPADAAALDRPTVTRRMAPALPPRAPDEAPAAVPPERSTRVPPAPRNGIAPSATLRRRLALGVPVLAFVALLAAIAIQALPAPRKAPVPWSTVASSPSAAAAVAAEATVAPAATPAAPAATTAPAPAAALEPVIRPEVLAIPAGEFGMGENVAGGAAGMAAPAHRVAVAGFTLMTTEVTVEQFAQFVRQTGYHNPRWKNYPCESAGARAPDWENPGFASGPSRPVVCVSLVDADAYAHWLSLQTGALFRLPTEAEWEYAARGRSTTRYWWGDRYDAAKASCAGCANARSGPQPVGSFPPNGFGLYDTAGNVREWTCSSGVAYGRGAETRCLPATVADRRAVRGGSWFDGLDQLRSAQRATLEADRRDVRTGFRLVREERRLAP